MTTTTLMDPFFRVEVINATANPNLTAYLAMHQDYSENFVYNEIQDMTIDERKAGEIIVRRLLKAKHFGPLEHNSIVFNVGWFPHSVMQQARTHRVACSFDVQSFRYTGHRIIRVALGELPAEEVFYLRPTGFYTDRQGHKYEYTKELRDNHLDLCISAAQTYMDNVEKHGMSEEHARSLIPFDTRQHFVVSFNARSLMHFMDLRAMKDAQLEIQQMCELMWPHFIQWMPEVAEWYETNRKGKNQLAP